MGQTSTEGNLDKTTLARLIEMIDENNCLAKLFRRTRDYYEGNGQEFNIRLLSDKGKGKEYDLPSTSEVVCLIVGDMSSTIGVRDIVVQFQSDTLQQIRDDHPLYMSLQYPLLFPYEDRLRWARNNQDVLRAELYSNVLNAVSKGDTDAKVIGQRFILPLSFTGGPRYLVEKYHEAMAICREYGNPDLFIKMTANPNWRGIKEHLEIYSGDSPKDRPDIECRVFKMKLDQLLKDFKKGTLFKPYTAALHRIEFQKRGLPYIILVWKVFQNTKFRRRYVLYRRRRNENESVVKSGANLNNTFVVPHNINLLKKYKVHINVEWCNRTSAVKYLFKYITKGVGRASAVIEKGNTETTSDTMASGEPKEKVIKQRNEIQEYIEARYLSACESMWQTFAFHIHKRKSSVEKFIIHLEGEHNITIKETDNLVRVIRKPGIEKTMFTEWMVLCRRSEFARTLTYVQIPEYFVWNNNSKVWTERDRYYLRILINKIKDPRSYDELKTFNDVKYPDFKSVCHARGYLDDDVEWLESMSEGARTATPYQLRDMFVTFLNNCFVASPKGLCEHSWKSMSEDILHKRQRILGHTNLELDDETLEQYTLIEVEKLMRMQDHSLNDIKEMSKIKPVLLKELGNSLWNQEMDYDVAEETLRHVSQYNLLNAQQRKTFLYQTIISRLRSRKQIVLPVASSGIAALLLPNGRTAHSRFNIPLKLDEDKLCNIKPGTMLAELIEKTDLIIWDETPMTHKHAFEALDKTLKDIMSMKNPHAKDQTFGGKTVLLGGDFRQILPVVPQGSRADTVLASISHSYLWNTCHKFPLKTNMQVNQDKKEFSDWLLKVGEGRPQPEQEDEDDVYQDQILTVNPSLVQETKDESLKQVVDAAYGDVNQIEAS
uniref:ATP-dependent DNA helicase n=1 Tax=Brassica oleracea var. oleracea TaxID=109376 RepID=A0A0D3E6U1_BRAOL